VAAPACAATSRSAAAARIDRHRRAVQIVLGLIWLLDGGLQFQSFMYSRGFVAMLNAGAAGAPEWLHASILFSTGIARADLRLFNTLFALTQVAIGLGLLYRPAVRPALVLGIAWALAVWWFGEAFGGIFTGAAVPLTGAPGAVVLYALVGLLAWPGPRPAGLLGARAARRLWAGLWLAMAWLWLRPASDGADATSSVLQHLGSGVAGLDAVARQLGLALAGDGRSIAIAMAIASACVGLGVAVGVRPRACLAVGAGLNLVFWIIGQGLGLIFAGGATDPNAGPLFCLLAFALLPATALASSGVDLPLPFSPIG